MKKGNSKENLNNYQNQFEKLEKTSFQSSNINLINNQFMQTADERDRDSL